MQKEIDGLKDTLDEDIDEMKGRVDEMYGQTPTPTGGGPSMSSFAASADKMFRQYESYEPIDLEEEKTPVQHSTRGQIATINKKFN